MSFPSFERAAAGAVFVLAWLMAAGCSDSTGPKTGALQVSVTTTGAELDTNGYSVAIDGGAGRVIPSNGTVTLSGLSAGSHSVLLAGLAPNCAPVGAANPRLGQSLTLTVTRRDGVGDTLRLSPVTWSSDNPAAVTVSPAGVVTAIAPGTATITAFADGRRGASTVNVNAP